MRYDLLCMLVMGSGIGVRLFIVLPQERRMTYLIGPLGENNWICLAQLPHSSGKQAYMLRTGVLCSLRPSTASQEEADAGIVCGPIGFLPAPLQRQGLQLKLYYFGI